MKPSAPKRGLWLLGMILGILGIVGYFVNIPIVTEYLYWFVVAGFGLLAIGTTFKGA